MAILGIICFLGRIICKSLGITEKIISSILAGFEASAMVSLHSSTLSSYAKLGVGTLFAKLWYGVHV